MRNFALWIAAALTVLSFPAGAAERRVGVVVVGPNTQAAGEMQAALQKTLAGEDFRLLDGTELVDLLGSGPSHEAPRPERIDATVNVALTKALDAYFELEYPQALDHLDVAKAALAQAPHDYPELHVRYHLLRSATYFGLGQGGGAQREADAAVLLDPDIEPDLAKFPPPFWNMLGQRAAALPAVDLKLSGLPDDTQVWVDGRPLPAPFEASVTRGKHWVTIHAPDRKALEQELDLRESTTWSVPLALMLSPRAETALEALVRDGQSYRDSAGLLEKVRGGSLDVLVVGLVGAAPAGSREPLRRVAVWRTTKGTDPFVDVRPTEGGDRFQLAAIESWTTEHAASALAAPASLASTAPESSPGWAFETEAALLFALRTRSLGYAPVGAPYTDIPLDASGPGLRVRGLATRRIGSNEIRVSIELQQYQYVAGGTTYVNQNVPDSTTRVTHGGSSYSAHIDAGYRLALLANGRLGLTPGARLSATIHVAEDATDEDGDLNAFTGYNRFAASPRVGVDYHLRRLAFGVEAGGYIPVTTIVIETPDPILGDLIDYTDGVWVQGSVAWELSNRWHLEGQAGLERFYYEFEGTASSRLDPTPTNVEMSERNLFFGLSLRRLF